MRMVGARVDLELGELLATEAVARQHALDRETDDLLRPALEHVVQGAGLQAARIARVAVVHLVGPLGARDRDLLRVDHDDEVARVDVRGVRRLALTAQRVGDLGGEAAEGLALRVDDEPVALAVGRFGDVSLHLEGVVQPRGSRAAALDDSEDARAQNSSAPWGRETPGNSGAWLVSWLFAPSTTPAPTTARPSIWQWSPMRALAATTQLRSVQFSPT